MTGNIHDFLITYTLKLEVTFCVYMTKFAICRTERARKEQNREER